MSPDPHPDRVPAGAPRLAGRLFTTIAAALAAITLAGCDAGKASSNPSGAFPLTGCALPAGETPKAAPNGYYVNGNTICTLAGKAHLLHGVARPSLEWDSNGQYLSPEDFALMVSWHANVVRVALNQDFWLSDSPHASPGYPERVDQIVAWAEQAGLDVILDLHWSDQGDYAQKPGQQIMADAHSKQFWSEVAGRYKGDGRVMFELYNEPHDVTPDVWLSGGSAGGFTVVGMQALHDAVRAAGAENLVIVGGLNWAFDLMHVRNHPVVGHNIVYASHPYNNSPTRQPDKWAGSFGYLTETSPVIFTEFGDGTGSCSPEWNENLLSYADEHHMSWTAWAWWAGDCKFPSLLTDWKGGTTKEGAVVKAALLGYDDPAPGGHADPPDAGGGGSGGNGGSGGAGSGGAGPSDGG